MPKLLALVSAWSTRAQQLLALLMGVFAGLGQAPWNLWWLALPALVVLVALFSTTERAKQAALIGWSAGLGYFGLVLFWIVEPFLVDVARHGWMAPFALVGLAGGMALFWGLAFALARRMGGGTVTLALAWTATELLRSYILTGFPWGLLSYIWTETPVLQLAAVFGPHGLTLLTLLFAASVHRFLLRQTPRTLGSVLLLGAFYPLGAFYTPGTLEPTDEPRPVVRLIQPNAPQHQKWDPEMIPVFFRRQLDFTAAEGNPDLIIWPETAVPYALTADSPVLPLISDAAGEAQVVFGAQRRDGDRGFNSLAVVDSTGFLQAVYDKHHLVPFGEYVPGGSVAANMGLVGFAAQNGFGFSPGPGPVLLDLGPLGRVLPLICYEAIFPQDVNAAPGRPDWILQITNDAWFGKVTGPYQHLAQARFRAVEQGLPMVRVANTGVSAVIDATGQVVESLPLGQAGYLDAALPDAAYATFYSQTGDSLVVLLLIVFSGVRLIARFRNSD